MRFDVVTIFPRLFEPFVAESVLGRALEKGLATVAVHDLRDWAEGRHKVTDDYPFGGGAGMVMKPEPLFAAVEELRQGNPGARVALMTPQGRVFDQEVARELASRPGMIILCGRYEGVDERVVEALVDEELSIGDYVLGGGEVPAMAVIEAVTRLLPGVVGREESVARDSFEGWLLDYPHYTRPAEFRGMKVPEVLLGGHHAEIERWRRRQSLARTLKRRPDLLAKAGLSDEDREVLRELEEEGGGGA